VSGRASLIDAIHRAGVDVRQALEWLGLPPPRGRVLRCPIPAHEDRHPSAALYRGRDGRERWHCHTCARGGDAIDLAEAVLGCDRRAALAWVADRAGIETTRITRREAERLERAHRVRGILRDALERAERRAILQPRPTPATLGVYDYAYGELDALRETWNERDADPFTRLVELRDWHRWATRTLRAAGVLDVSSWASMMEADPNQGTEHATA
jgi:hypothetical protein